MFIQNKTPQTQNKTAESKNSKLCGCLTPCSFPQYTAALKTNSLTTTRSLKTSNVVATQKERNSLECPPIPISGEFSLCDVSVNSMKCSIFRAYLCWV